MEDRRQLIIIALIISISTAVTCFIGNAYFFIENNNLKNKNHKWEQEGIQHLSELENCRTSLYKEEDYFGENIHRFLL